MRSNVLIAERSATLLQAAAQAASALYDEWMSSQQQFLNVVDRDEAQRRFRSALALEPLGAEEISLDVALGRALAEDVVAAVDVPSFDRSNYDGYAVQASDCTGASEDAPVRLQLLRDEINTGVVPTVAVTTGQAVGIATGGMLPRGADAVVMVEDCDVESDRLIVRRAVAAGFGVAFAGTDIAAGETVLFRGTELTSRETGVLAAIGCDRAAVYRRPRVAILSTGDEIIAPGEPMTPPKIYDSNARVLADAVRELGGEPVMLGIVADDHDQLRKTIQAAIKDADCVLLSGGTSKGRGDISYRVVGELTDPGIVAHGVALKPGKPICLAVTQNKPVVILPGFPTSAIFTFHEFVAPVLQELAGRPRANRNTLPAELAVKVNSEIGRTEYLLVGLVESGSALRDGQPPEKTSLPPENYHNEPLRYAAFPMGKGSGSVTTFSSADGFITIDRHQEIVAAGTPVTVTVLGKYLAHADLVVIGTAYVGRDKLRVPRNQQGLRTRLLTVGSTAGLDAARRGQCDLAGVHLLDEATGQYNRPFLSDDLELVEGYGRMQGVLFRAGDARFTNRDAQAAIEAIKVDPNCRMVNRNRGSGTRILIDRLLQGATPAGYAAQAKSHNAVAAAVVQGRADWGIAIKTVADQSGLGFLPLAAEQYDFVIPRSRRNRPAVQAFVALLQDPAIRATLSELGFTLPS